MRMHIRRAADRGQGDHGWLQSQHSFSFAGYYDPQYMGFGHLRVINQDVVAPGRGFGTHPHRDMEIISYVVDGALEHKDTIGTGSVIRPGEVQLMSAGRGIAHSEYNHSGDDTVQFLQIWILPRESGGDPGYQQRAFPKEEGGALRRVVSPDGADGTLSIKQDMDLYRLLLAEGEATTHRPARDRVWVQVVHGTLDVAGARLFPGDGLAIVEAKDLAMTAHEGDVEALVFDLA
jgi:redox-sensitive bicupin YhaK (pirin superfamily)